jgi:ubiquinone/menaquinone biosynthesis methyltransferase
MNDSSFKMKKNTEKTDKKKFVQRVFSDVSLKYDLMNDIMSFGLHRTWKHEVVSLLKINKKSIILDLAAGSGDITKKILEEYNCQCIPYDSNMMMLKSAQKKLKKYNLSFINGDAENLPFKNLTFDYVIVSFGLRNFTNINNSLNEVFRVLKKNGKLICLEFSEVNNQIFRRIINIYYKVIPLLGNMFGRNKMAYEYLVNSIKKFPNQIKLSKKLKDAGFKSVKVIDIIGGVAAIHISKK